MGAFSKSLVLGLVACSDAFLPTTKHVSQQRLLTRQPRLHVTATEPDVSQPAENESDTDALLRVAAQLRAEASAAQDELNADLAERAREQALGVFREFDEDSSGAIDPPELAKGLERVAKTRVTEEQAAALVKKFDVSDDGELQVEEWMAIGGKEGTASLDPIGTLRAELRELLKEARKEADKVAAQAKDIATAETAKALDAAARKRLDDGWAAGVKGTDRALAVAPYALPFVDALTLLRPLTESTPEGSPLGDAARGVTALAAAYSALPLVPLFGFIAVSSAVGNEDLPLVARFNAQQAVLLDLALFVPSIVLNLVAMTGKIPVEALGALATASGGLALLAIAYATTATLATGNKPGLLGPLSSRATTAVELSALRSGAMFEGLEEEVDGETKTEDKRGGDDSSK